MWRETGKDLALIDISMGTLSASDKYALTALCLAVTRMRENAELVDRSGNLIKHGAGSSPTRRAGWSGRPWSRWASWPASSG